MEVIFLIGILDTRQKNKNILQVNIGGFNEKNLF